MYSFPEYQNASISILEEIKISIARYQFVSPELRRAKVMLEKEIERQKTREPDNYEEGFVRGCKTERERILTNWCQFKCRSDGTLCRGTPDECFISVALQCDKRVVKK